MRLRHLAFLALACIAAAPTHPVATVLALVHVTVIDATGAAAKPHMTVIISDGRITEIGTSPKIHPPGNAQIIDAANKFLIPGLWDMHVHWGDTDFLPLFLGNGVTGIRIMWGSRAHSVITLRPLW